MARGYDSSDGTHAEKPITLRGRQETAIITIPASAARALRGPRGVDISALAKHTKCSITIPRNAALAVGARSGGPENSKAAVAVEITGTPYNIFYAKDQVAAAVVTSTVSRLIPARAVGPLIGKGGVRIAELQRTTGASVRVDNVVVRRRDGRGGQWQKVEVTGTKRALARAKTAIDATLLAGEERAKFKTAIRS